MPLVVQHVLAKTRRLSTTGSTTPDTTVTRTITDRHSGGDSDGRPGKRAALRDQVNSDATGAFVFPAVQVGNNAFDVTVEDGTDTDTQSFPAARFVKKPTAQVVLSGSTAQPNTQVHLHVHYRTPQKQTGRYTYAKPSGRDKRFRFALPEEVHFPSGLYTFVLVFDDEAFVSRQLLEERKAGRKAAGPGKATRA